MNGKESVAYLQRKIASINDNNRTVYAKLNNPVLLDYLRQHDRAQLLELIGNYEDELNEAISQNKNFSSTIANLLIEGVSMSEINKLNALFVDAIELDTKMLKLLKGEDSNIIVNKSFNDDYRWEKNIDIEDFNCDKILRKSNNSFVVTLGIRSSTHHLQFMLDHLERSARGDDQKLFILTNRDNLVTQAISENGKNMYLTIEDQDLFQFIDRNGDCGGSLLNVNIDDIMNPKIKMLVVVPE